MIKSKVNMDMTTIVAAKQMKMQILKILMILKEESN